MDNGAEIYVSHTESKNMHIKFFDINYSCGALRLLKYLNHLHELCVTVTAAAATAGHADEQAKLQ